MRHWSDALNTVCRSGRKPARTLWTLAAAVMIGTGCQNTPLKRVAAGPEHQPANVYRPIPTLPPDLRRVAVLPLSGDESQVESVAANHALEPVLRTELLKVGKCEWQWITSEALRQWTGQKCWAAEDALPPNFLKELREQTDCDAVLFSRVSRYHPYPPLVVGWRFRLVSVADGQTVWAFDETFDASEAPVSNSALRYEKRHPTGAPTIDKPMILTSPRRFGQYAASVALGTLPDR